MGKRSGIIDHEDGLAGLSLANLDHEIARCRLRLGIAGQKYLDALKPNGLEVIAIAFWVRLRQRKNGRSVQA